MLFKLNKKKIREKKSNFNFIVIYNIMDKFTMLFWFFFMLFISLSVYLLCCTKKTNIFYLQVASGCGMFATSKIGRNFLGFV
jgi:hypothetical protein